MIVYEFKMIKPLSDLLITKQTWHKILLSCQVFKGIMYIINLFYIYIHILSMMILYYLYFVSLEHIVKQWTWINLTLTKSKIMSWLITQFRPIILFYFPHLKEQCCLVHELLAKVKKWGG